MLVIQKQRYIWIKVVLIVKDRRIIWIKTHWSETMLPSIRHYWPHKTRLILFYPKCWWIGHIQFVQQGMNTPRHNTNSKQLLLAYFGQKPKIPLKSILPYLKHKNKWWPYFNFQMTQKLYYSGVYWCRRITEIRVYGESRNLDELDIETGTLAVIIIKECVYVCVCVCTYASLCHNNLTFLGMSLF